MRKSGLTDAGEFARDIDIDIAYRAMWRQWCGA
jgi:hypothetical protein